MLLAANDPKTAVGRACYCTLHTAQALLREQDIRFRKHSPAIADSVSISPRPT